MSEFGVGRREREMQPLPSREMLSETCPTCLSPDPFVNGMFSLAESAMIWFHFPYHRPCLGLCVTAPAEKLLSQCPAPHNGQPSFVITSRHLLLPGFSLARTRSVFISIHQARDEVRCYCYDKCIRDNREDSDAFENSIPDSCLNRNVLLVPPVVLRVKNTTTCDRQSFLPFQMPLATRS